MTPHMGWLIFLLPLCALVCLVVYVLTRPTDAPEPEADTGPPSDFLPDITTRTDRELWNAINKGVEK